MTKTCHSIRCNTFLGKSYTIHTMKVQKQFACEECSMKFTDEIRLMRHYKKAHPPKQEDFKQRWYWSNPVFP